jgi:hypothetical protein
MKQKSQTKSNPKSNPNPKGKTFLGKGEQGWSLGGALESIFRAMHSSALRALDISVVVIDRMTMGREGGETKVFTNHRSLSGRTKGQWA